MHRVRRQTNRTADIHSTGIPPWQIGNGYTGRRLKLRLNDHFNPLRSRIAKWIDVVRNLGHEGILLSAGRLGSAWTSLHFGRFGHLNQQIADEAAPGSISLGKFLEEIRGSLSLREVPVSGFTKEWQDLNIDHLLAAGCPLVSVDSEIFVED